MGKILIDYILVYGVITIVAGLLVLWLGAKEKYILPIIAASSAVSIILFWLFFMPNLFLFR